MPKWAAQHRSHAATRPDSCCERSRRYLLAGFGPGLRSVNWGRAAACLELWSSCHLAQGAPR
eukprot:2702971-Prymnesium_polylepis.1